MSPAPSSPAPGGPAPTRVYVPATPSDLARAVATGHLRAAAAHAVTPALREWYAGGDLEELELAALTDAAQSSLLLIAAERDAAGPGQGGAEVPPSLPRRLVVAADTTQAAQAAASGGAAAGPSAVGERPTGRSRVLLHGSVPWSAVVSLHVDEAEAVADVAAAVLAVDAAAAGDEAALHAVEDAEALDLLWYDVTEAEVLLADLAEPAGG